MPSLAQIAAQTTLRSIDKIENASAIKENTEKVEALLKAKEEIRKSYEDISRASRASYVMKKASAGMLVGAMLPFTAVGMGVMLLFWGNDTVAGIFGWTLKGLDVWENVRDQKTAAGKDAEVLMKMCDSRISEILETDEQAVLKSSAIKSFPSKGELAAAFGIGASEREVAQSRYEDTRKRSVGALKAS